MLRYARQFRIRSLLVLTAFFAIVVVYFRPIAGPSIAATKSRIDIGTVSVGTSGTCEFELVNSSPTPIRIYASGLG